MSESTWIARLTPAGKAAVATFGVRGPDAWEAVRAVFRPRRGALPAEPPADAVWLGQLGDDVRDEVVLAVRRGGPAAWLEVHCHGGPEVVRLVEEVFARRGVAALPWPELERRSGEPPWRVAVQEWLVQAPTARTAAILLDQYDGAFHCAVEAIRAELAAAKPEAAREGLDHLAGYTAVGRHLVRPWSVVLAGAPNVGKSSLFNALAGYTRSVVAPTAGTTRDVVRLGMAIDGWPVELSDTAGLRAATGAVEYEGVARGEAALRDADLRLWVVDGSVEPAAPPPAAAAGLLLINKVDLAPAWDWARFPDALRVSARTGAGLPALCAAIASRLVPEALLPGAAVPFAPEWCDCVEEARQRLREGRPDLAALALGGPEPV